ncbi:MAG: T9SS type A sorting domain-containing protein [Elusimicrobiota bacterium]|jgi:hypothetical protein
MKQRLLIAALLLSSWSSPIFAALPVIFYSDLVSGPKTGGENNKGAYVTIFGKNFGATRGASSVSIGGGQADNYPVWSDSKISFQLGAGPNTGNITVTTADGTSNGIPFSIRACNISFVSTSGNDAGGGGISDPWRHLTKVRQSLAKGGICYVRGGTYTDTDEGAGNSGYIFYVSGSYPWGSGAPDDGAPYCLVGYPGETVTWRGDNLVANYVNDTSYAALNSNIVFANMIMDGNNNNHGMVGWNGVANDATYRVKNVRFVNLDIKNYQLLSAQAGGGASQIGVGGAGPVDNVKILGCQVHHVRSWTSLDHLVYMTAGGDNYEIAWCDTFDLMASDSGYPGYNIQFHAGGFSDYDDFTNVSVHDNRVHDNHGRGGINFADRVISANCYNNVIFDITSTGSYVGFPVRLQSQSPGTVNFYNNTIYTAGTEYLTALIDFSRTNTFYVRNNIFYTANTKAYSDVSFSPTIVASNNLFYGNGAPPSWASGQLNSDPSFINEAGYDFHLQSLSPAIGAGVTIGGLTADFDGVPRPQASNGQFAIGAYEYNVGYVPPPPAPPPGDTPLPLPLAETTPLSSIRAYPNPWRSDRHQGLPVTFDNLTANSTLKLYTLSGHWIRTLDTSAGSAGWDLKNDSGDKVASGIYLYVITNNQGQKTKGKLVIIK